MGDTTIEWTDSVWNPVRGCSRISRGCEFCYAERMAARFSGPGAPFEGFARHILPLRGLGSNGEPRWTGRVELIPEKLDEPLRWRKPRRVFVNSMSDLFHEALPDAAIDRVFAVMAHCPQHTFQVLTKRPERMLAYMTHRYRRGAINDAACLYQHAPIWSQSKGKEPSAIGPDWPLLNVWLGVSCEDQKTADERIPLLLQTPAALRFVSLEPLLGPIELREVAHFHEFEPDLDWVIVGGESGPGARACDVKWIRPIVRQCRAASVACFVKQLGPWPIMDGVPMRLKSAKGGDPAEWPEDIRVREYPDSSGSEGGHDAGYGVHRG